METRLTSFLNAITRWCVYAVVALIPLWFLPFTLEYFEFPKFLLLCFLMIIAVLSFLARALIKKTVELHRSVLDIPLLLIVFLYALSSVFSYEPALSFLGNFNSFGLSFLTVSLLVTFYFLVVQQCAVKSEQKILSILLCLTGSMAAIYYILAVFKLLPTISWLPGLFLTGSSVETFGIFLIMSTLLALGLGSVKKTSLVSTALAAATVILTTGALILVGQKSFWALLIIGLAGLLILFFAHLQTVRFGWLLVIFSLCSLGFLFILLGTPRLIPALPPEQVLSQKVGAEVAFTTVTEGVKHFMLGTGPETYSYAYARFKPLSLNAAELWDARPSFSTSAFADFITTTGVPAGLVLVAIILIIIGTILSAIWKASGRPMPRTGLHAAPAGSDREEDFVYTWGFITVWIVLTAGLFFHHYSILILVLYALITGVTIAEIGRQTGLAPAGLLISLKTTQQYALLTSFCFIIVFIICGVFVLYETRFYRAEEIYAKNFAEAPLTKVAAMKQAIAFNPYRSLFRIALSEAEVRQAEKLFTTPNSSEQVYKIVAEAIAAGRAATTVSPKSVVAWQYLATLYGEIRPLTTDADEWIIKSLNQAIELEPANPVLYLARANAYVVNKKIDEAKSDLEFAETLKPNLLDTYVRLAAVYDLEKDTEKALAVMQKGLLYGQANPEYLVRLGAYYFNRSKNDTDVATAAALFQEALVINPDYADALYGLAVLYERQNKIQEALPLYRRLLDLNPGNKEIQEKINALVAQPASSGKKK